MTVLGLAFVLCGCSPAVLLLTDPRARVDEQHGIHWINDREVLFVGFKPEDIERMKNDKITATSRIDHVLYVADVNTGAVREHAILEDYSAMCYSAGMVLYRRKGGKYSYGEFGKEKEDDKISDSLVKYGLSRSERCHNVDRSGYPPWPSLLFPLLEEDGVLELRFTDRAQNYVGTYLWKPNATEPMLVSKRYVSGVKFAAFKGAYFWGGAGNVDKVEAYWFYPDGRLEPLQISNQRLRQLSRGNFGFFPIKVGMLANVYVKPETFVYLLYPDFRTRNSFTEDDMRLVFRGVIWRSDISPDGCKMAVATGPMRIPNSNPSKLEIIDLCR